MTDQSQKKIELSTEDKAKILDWLLEPSQSRPDRPATIAKSINKNHLTSLFEFRVWGTRQEFIDAVMRRINADNEQEQNRT